MTTATTDFLTRGHLLIKEPIRYQAHEYETASAYNVYMLQPGEYPFRLTEIGGQPWVPGKVESGFVRPKGPYYAKVTIDAIQTEFYYVSRLFTASKVQHDTDLNKPTTFVRRIYAYELYKRKTLLDSKAEIVLPLRWRDDTYRPIERLDDQDYDMVLSKAVWWLKRHTNDDYTGMEHWHIWNRINARAVAGIDGWVKAVLEGYL
jgi:hypothetical protein